VWLLQKSGRQKNSSLSSNFSVANSSSQPYGAAPGSAGLTKSSGGRVPWWNSPEAATTTWRKGATMAGATGLAGVKRVAYTHGSALARPRAQAFAIIKSGVPYQADFISRLASNP